MSEVVKLRTRVDIDEEAAAWAWRMDSPDVTPAERQAYEAWLRQDPRHARASKELNYVWQQLDGLAEAKREEKIATFSELNKALRASRQRWWMAAAAALVAGVALGVAWFEHGSELQVLATAVGQERSVTLADGSVVSLNTNTIVETNLARHMREIFLKKGEAHFRVAHDTSRPFLVHAGDAVVRAVGTEFEVRVRQDQHVDVVVNEGRVEVRPAEVKTGTAAQVPVPMRAVSAGERLSTANRDYVVSAVTPAQLSSSLAWREGAIVFEGERLADAIAEVGRYTDTRIIVTDPATAELRVGGRFRTGDMQEFFAALQAALPVNIRRTDDAIFIDPRR